MSKTAKLDKWIAVLEDIASEASGDLSVNQLLILAITGRNSRLGEETTTTDIVQRLAMPNASASRNIRSLGEWRAYEVPGYNLLEHYNDPRDLRRSPFRLTEEGQRILKQTEKRL